MRRDGMIVYKLVTQHTEKLEGGLYLVMIECIRLHRGDLKS